MDSGLLGGGRRRRKALLLALCKRLHGPQQSATSPKICTDSQLIRLTLLPFNSRILAIRLQGVIGWEWHRGQADGVFTSRLGNPALPVSPRARRRRPIHGLSHTSNDSRNHLAD